jgi:hypothetical protein
MLLGFYLQKGCKLFKNAIIDDLTALIEEGGPIKEQKKIIKNVIEFKEPLWCLIALTHDLGYPIEKTKRANEMMSRMINNFGFLSQKQYDYNFTVVHQTAISELLNIMSGYITLYSKKRYLISTNSGMRLDFAKSFERLDHGVMSAYLLLTTLDYICDTMSVTFDSLSIYDDPKDISDMVAVILLLSAISAHTNKNWYTQELYDTPTLLFLCDELEEFSRYCRSKKTHDWVESSHRIEVELKKDLLRMNYTFDDHEAEDNIDEFSNKKSERSIIDLN